MNLKLLYLSSFFLFLFLCIMIIYIKKNTRGKYTSELKVSILLYYDKNNTYIQSLLYNLVKYKNIDEILVIYTGKLVPFRHFKVKFFQDESIKNYSSFIRFFYLDKCRNNNIILLNNDIIPSERLLLKLLFRYKKDTMNYYGVFPVSCTSSGYKNFSLYSNIIVSPIILTSKEILERTWEDMIEKKEEMIEKNMDDILFQYYFEKIYGKQPIQVRGKFKKFSSSLKRFYEYKLKNEYCKKLYKKNKYKEEDFY